MKNLSVFTIGLMLILVPTACKKDDMDPATVPLFVKTSIASDITEHSVKLSSTLQSDGASPITDYGHVYSETNATPSLKNCIKIPHGSFSGVFPDEFSSTLNVLKSNTTYHVRPYATNKVGTSYGDVLDIKTSIASPTVVFESKVGVDDLTGSSFKVTSTISSNGTVAITQHGHVYGPNNDPTLETAEKTAKGANGGPFPAEFSSVIAGLKTNTIYYVRPYATNEKGTVYGERFVVKTTFDEQPPAPDKSPVN